jgi:hypothetical protein
VHDLSKIQVLHRMLCPAMTQNFTSSLVFSKNTIDIFLALGDVEQIDKALFCIKVFFEVFKGYLFLKILKY